MFVQQQSHTQSFVLNTWKKSLLLLVLLECCAVSYCKAKCLLSLESAHTMRQGDVNTAASFLGGQKGIGFASVTRLGMKGGSELHLRAGACDYRYKNAAGKQVSFLTGVVEAGGKFMILKKRSYGVDLSMAMSTYSIQGSDGDIRGNAISSVGFVPYLMVGYPFQITKNRSAFVAMSLGGSLSFVDENYGVSNTVFDALFGFSAGVDILTNWSILSEVRFHQYFYGGGALAFHF